MIEWLVLASLNVILFAKSLSCGIVIDDDNMVNVMRERKKELKKDKSWKNIKNFIEVATYGAGFPRNSTQDHAISISINIINTILIYQITNSFLCALIWMCNPVNNQISLWLNGRRYALSIMFSLLALKYKLFFIPLAGIAAWRHIISAPLFLLSGNIYLSTICGLLIFLLAVKKYKGIFRYRKKAFSENNELQKITPMKAIIYIKTFGYYILHMLLPLPKMYHKNLYYFGRYEHSKKKAYALDKEFWVGVTIFSFFVYEMMIGNFWAFWVVLFISQWCGICTVTMNAADRYCSLPLVGIIMLGLKYMAFLPQEIQIPIFISLITIYLIRYLRMFRAYAGVHSFFEYHLEINPADVEARVYYAERVVRDEPFKAVTLLNDGLKMMPFDFKLLFSMVLVQIQVKRWDQVDHFIKRAEKVIPLGDEQETKEQFARIRRDLLDNSMKQFNRAQRRKMKKNG